MSVTREYDCPACGEFELEEAISAKRLKRCPTCNKKVEPLISGGVDTGYRFERSETLHRRLKVFMKDGSSHFNEDRYAEMGIN